MTLDPHEEPVHADSPDGHAPAGEAGVAPSAAVPEWGATAAAAETAPLEAAAAEPKAGSQPELQPEPGPRPRWSRRARTAFRDWRRTRPFWGGLLALLGGGEIIFTYKAPMALVMHFGLYGLAGYLVPGVLILLGLLILFDPQHRTFYSVLAVMAALATWLTSNLGGFIIGMLLGLIGGSLAFGWQAGAKPKAARKRRRRYRPSTTH